jgi:1,4-dihydroxy-2-naphthoyl-CoA hydrolase
MAIWFREYTVEEINQRGQHTMADFLGIEFTEINSDNLVAKMPVSSKVKQPIGIVHGGANVVLAETVASTAANMVVDIDHFYCVGLEINTNHIRSVREGVVWAISKPFHLGRSTQVWHIELFDEQRRTTAISRMTASVLKRSS